MRAVTEQAIIHRIISKKICITVRHIIVPLRNASGIVYIIFYDHHIIIFIPSSSIKTQYFIKTQNILIYIYYSPIPHCYFN